MIKPCSDFIKELDLSKKLAKRKDGSDGRYMGLDFQRLLVQTNAPLEVAIELPSRKGKKKKRKNKVIFHCGDPKRGPPEFQRKEWCATKMARGQFREFNTCQVKFPFRKN